MNIYVGYGRYNENHQATGGLPGDQLQTGTPNYNGEVALATLDSFLEESPNHTATVYRIADAKLAAKIGAGIVKGCNNKYIGYDENNRNSVLAYGVFSGKNGKPVECDDTSLARVVLKYGIDIDLGDFDRNSVRDVLENSKLFLDPIGYTPGTQLYIGDVLVCDGSNRVGIVGEGEDRPIPHPTPGGTSDYNDLDHKPSVNGKTLMGDSSLSSLGIVTPKVVDSKLIFS